jgi:hypothetical protein
MNERCDGCGRQTPVLAIIFTGREYLCAECMERKSPMIIQLSARVAA